MKKTIKTLGIIAFAAVVFFSMAACDEEIEEGLRVDGIPTEFNGKFAVFGSRITKGEENINLYGGEKFSYSTEKKEWVITASPISDGSVVFPIWTLDSNDKVVKYSGSDDSEGYIAIFEESQIAVTSEGYVEEVKKTRNFSKIQFTDGNSSVDWSSGISP